MTDPAPTTTTTNSPWRRLASAAWGSPNDPQIYGDLDVDATKLLAFIEQARTAGDAKVTPTHVMGWALAQTFAATPDLNVQLRRRKFVPRASVGIFYIATGADPHELTGTLVDTADELDVAATARALSQQMSDVRSGHDPTLEKTKTLVNRAPARVLKHSLRFASWLSNDVGVDWPKLGLPRQPFGSAMITSVGGLGLERGYAPLAHYYRVPVLIFVGKITDKAVVRDGEVVARPILPITATIDHRYVDGWMVSRALKVFRASLEDPAAHGG